MKQKVSTLLDPALFRQVKLQSVVEGRQINEIVGEALELYLAEKAVPGAGRGLVAESWGALRLEPSEVRRIVEDEDGLFDA